METLKLVDTDPDKAKKWAQKLHRKKDDISMIRKGYVASVSEEGVKPEERAIIARVSTNDRDRDGEIVDAKGIDFSAYYPGNAVLCWAHDYKIPTIGRAQWVKLDDNGLVCKFEFAETQFADEIYRLYKGKFLNAFSIGFIPLDYDTKEKIHRKVSLLEVSAVPVPANQNALVMEAYQKGLIKNESLMADFGIEAETTPETKQSEPPIVRAEAMETKMETKDAEPLPNPPEFEGVEGRKDADADAPTTPPIDFAALMARLDDLSRKVDALATPPAPVQTAPAREDVIEIDREDALEIEYGSDIDIDSIATPPAPKLSAHPPAGVKSIPAETIEAAITQAVNRLNLKSIVAEAVDLSIARLRGKVK